MSSSILYAQDTVRITLQQAEQEFLNKNLLLLAEKYNIDAAKAQVIQARLYNNPDLSVYGNIYNPQNKKIADIGNRTGEYVVELQQVIRLAGKRNKEIALAEAGIGISQNKFFDLLRTLKYTLRTDFFRAYYIHSSIEALDRQIISIQSLDTAYQTLQQKSVVTVKDALRIRALLYYLQASRSSLQNELNDVLSELRLLMQDNQTLYLPVIAGDPANTVRVQDLSLQTLVDTAFANRYDLRVVQSSLEYNIRNLSLQKALSMPDLTVGAQFDKRGSFVDNATFLNLAMDLPFFKKNQGNIKAASIGVAQTKAQLEQQRFIVSNEVQKAYSNALAAEKLLQSFDPAFLDQYEKMLVGINDNFQRKNLSLLEFTDFYESYKNNIQQFNQLRNERIQAIETLDFSVGKTIINY